MLPPYSTCNHSFRGPQFAALAPSRHVMYQGRILKSGGKELADKLDEDACAKTLSTYSCMFLQLNAGGIRLGAQGSEVSDHCP